MGIFIPRNGPLWQPALEEYTPLCCDAQCWRYAAAAALPRHSGLRVSVVTIGDYGYHLDYGYQVLLPW